MNEQELRALGTARQCSRLAMLKTERARLRKQFNEQDQKRKDEIDLLTSIYKEDKQ